MHDEGFDRIDVFEINKNNIFTLFFLIFINKVKIYGDIRCLFTVCGQGFVMGEG